MSRDTSEVDIEEQEQEESVPRNRSYPSSPTPDHDRPSTITEVMKSIYL